MSFFGILNRGVDSDFSIEDCHINFWVLPRGFKKLFRPTYAFDIGLRIKANGTNFSWLRIALPFDCADDSKPIDLSEFVLDGEFAPLIFGKPVNISRSTVTYDDPSGDGSSLTLRVKSINEASSVQEDANKHKNGFSTWKIHVSEPVEAGSDCYVRFRFVVASPKRFWMSQGWGLAKKGNILDLRVSDARESALLNEGRDEVAHLMPIKRLFLFIGLASNFVPRRCSPDLYYSRALEPKVWKKYLNSAGEHLTDYKLVIHQWRNASANIFKEVSKDYPFRGYLDVSREFGLELLVLYSIVVSFPILVQIVRGIWGAVFG